MISRAKLASLIDHTLLRPDASSADIERLCEEAKEHSFRSVCVNPSRAALARRLLEETAVSVCAVISFPFGAETAAQKAAAAREMESIDIDELDMVINIGAVKDGNFDLVLYEIEAVRSSFCGGLLKVILETCLLSDEEKARVCQIAAQAGADYVKTSTGYSDGGATVHDVSLLKKHCGPLRVKASGGIKDLDSALLMLEAGADRLGLSSGVAIVSDSRLD